MSKRKAEDISNDNNDNNLPATTTIAEEEVTTVPVRSRRAVRRAVATSTPATTTSTTTISTNSTTTADQKNEVSVVTTNVEVKQVKEEPFSKREQDLLDEHFSKFMFTLATYYHRGFSDFKLSAINELYNNSNGGPISVDTLKTLQYIVPELFTIYLNHNHEICINVSNDFEKIKSSIVGLWKKRIATIEKPHTLLETPIEIRSIVLPIRTTTTLKQFETSQSTATTTKSTTTTEQPKKSIEEMLKENDRREQEELERAKVLSKKFESDRVTETLLVTFTVLKMKKKTKMDLNTLVEELKNRYTKHVTPQELKSHLELLCKHVPTLFTATTFGNLKVFEISKDAKFDKAKKILEDVMMNQQQQ